MLDIVGMPLEKKLAYVLLSGNTFIDEVCEEVLEEALLQSGFEIDSVRIHRENLFPFEPFTDGRLDVPAFAWIEKLRVIARAAMEEEKKNGQRSQDEVFARIREFLEPRDFPAHA